jgi:chitodextrinase
MNRVRNESGSHRTVSIARALESAARALRIALSLLLIGTTLPLAAQSTMPTGGSSKFIPTFIIYYGGGPALVAADAPKLAKFDLIDLDRFRYAEIGSNTWAAVKSINPDVQIYLYEMGPEAPAHLDGVAQLNLNGLGRYDVSRGHFMGSLNGNHPELFLLDALGNRIYSLERSNPGANQYWHLMDFGAPAYQSYWLTAVKADIVDMPWVADGVFVDNCFTRASAGNYSAIPSLYPTNTAWSDAMNSFANAITAGLRGHGQKVWCNRGGTDSVNGAAAWLTLDGTASLPDVLLEGNAFAVDGESRAVRFHSEMVWKRQVDTLRAISNSKVAVMSHTKLLEDQTGTDNNGNIVTYWQTLWYSLGSFLLAKNDVLGNAYFMFRGGSGYNKIWWHDEYDNIDLGKAMGPYAVTTVGSVNVYWREFEKGYVYVNPSRNHVASVTLPQASRLLTRANMSSAPDSIPSVSAFALNAHHAAILLKVETPPPPDTTAPTVPGGLTGTAVSPTQINLSWNASTDDVGVTGYMVYLNDAVISATSATSFSHTGLTAGTTYNYRVSAYDAVPNHSPSTAPVAVTTPLPLDTTAPATPAGLTASAITPTSFTLSWDAATDNVGVTGYRVYRDGALVASPSSTSASIDGLAASTLYAFTVAAVDAAGNASAPSAPLSVTTPAAPDTTPPSTPTGLTGTAVSSSQVDLSWNAATDNVGVTGYSVYLNDTLLTRIATTSFQHTGLSAGTTYNYRVSAHDAVLNHSAWTATPVAVTTPATPETPAPDTQAPSVPTGLVGIAVSSSQINLSWNAATDNVGVTGYSVYLNDKLFTRTTTTSFQHTGLSAGTTYSYRVSAHDAVLNHSAWTATPVTVTTPAAPDTQAPAVPTGLAGTAVSSSQVNLTWNPATDNVGVTGYVVYLNDVSLATTTTTSFSHTGLTPGVTYNYRVSAYDAVPNHSAWTATPVAVTTPAAPDTQAPAVPTGLTGTAVSSSQINLSWNAATDNVGVTGYSVYLNDTLLTRTTTTSFQHTGLSAGTTYNYRVSAYDAVPNHSAWTATPVAVTTPAAADTQAPSVPAGLLSTAVSSSQISLSWNASTDNVGVTGYRVYNGTLVASPTTTSVSITGLSASTLYAFTVVAVDAAGNASAPSAPLSVTTPAAPDTTAPTTPTGLTASAITSTSLTLSWSAATDNVGVSGYSVFRNGVRIANVSTTSYSDTGLVAATTYSYTIAAYDAAGNASALSAAVSATTLALPDTQAPSVPTGLTGTAVSSSQINLSWNAATDNVGVTGYSVYLNDTLLTRIATTSFQHTGLSAGTTYNYRVSAYDAVPNHSAWTATPVAVTTPAPAVVTPQATTFSSTLAEFSNPERGLSRMWSDLSNLTSSWLVAHRNAGYRLVTHRQSLANYVNTATLPQSFLDSLNAGAALHRANGTKMAMQFTYWNVSGSPEPTLTTILGHIAQLKPFFTANADVIAAVHGGFLGQYGEWAFSSEPSVGSPTPSAAAKIAVRDALLAAVPAEIPIGWRYVADLMKWYPTPLNESQAFTGANQARSGLHNDCFLSNKDDSGTYWESGVSPTGRTPEDNKFRAYHAVVSNWTTMGGENCNSGQYTACADVLNDGPLYHWRYLRDDWGTVFHDGWKAQGCYPEIKRSLGYRFQLDAISHPQSVARAGVASVDIDLRNVGWARIFTARRLVVTLRHIASGALITGNAGDMKLLPPRATSSTRIVVAVPIPAAASPGDYDVYVSMPDIWPATKDKADFAVRFANADDAAKGQAWEAANFRFKTGTMLTVQ